jgi:exodeoxyribonuclease VII small subunit
MAKKTKTSQLSLKDPENGETDGDPTSNEQNFEQCVERLSTIVERLEDGELPLEESLRLFEEGVRLARLSQARLDNAEKRVEQLLRIDEDGRPVVREIEPE